MNSNITPKRWKIRQPLKNFPPVRPMLIDLIEESSKRHANYHRLQEATSESSER